MIIVAIDPGFERSAWIAWNSTTGRARQFGITGNDVLLSQLRAGISADVDVVAIEQIESFGMAVGREVFDTVHWAGRFTEAIESRGGHVVQVTRRAVKLAICGSARAKDANIRQALIDRFGGSAAIGRKGSEGPLYGISKDVWSALAIAVTWADQHEEAGA